jgi:hypothetical protein
MATAFIFVFFDYEAALAASFLFGHKKSTQIMSALTS